MAGKNLIWELILTCLAKIYAPTFPFGRFYLYYFLDIVPSYHPMQFKGKLMKQIGQNDKKPNFRPNFGRLWPDSNCQFFLFFFFFFSKIWLSQSLDKVSYHLVQYQKKIMIQSWEWWADKQTDEQMDYSDFIGCCLNNNKHPKSKTVSVPSSIIKYLVVLFSRFPIKLTCCITFG